MHNALSGYRRHPDLALLLAKSSDDRPGLQRLMEATLAVLVEAGLTHRQAADWCQVIETHVVGAGLYFAVLEQRPDPRLDDRDGLRRSFAMLPEDRFPHSRQAAPYLFPDVDDAFDLATGAILDAIERSTGQTSSPDGDAEPR
jgi:hypothetical protein